MIYKKRMLNIIKIICKPNLFQNQVLILKLEKIK